MSTLGLSPLVGAWPAIEAGCQSATLPSMVIGYVDVGGVAGPKRGSRRRATLRSGITYSFQRVIEASRWKRAAPSPFVKPFPFVRPLVMPRRIAASPFVSPFVRPPAWRPLVTPLVRPTPFVRPLNPLVSPFVRPLRPFVSPFVLL